MVIDYKKKIKIENYLLVEIIKLQKALGMPDEDVDGIWGPTTDAYIKEYLSKDEEK